MSYFVPVTVCRRGLRKEPGARDAKLYFDPSICDAEAGGPGLNLGYTETLLKKRNKTRREGRRETQVA